MGSYHNKLDKKYFNKSVYIKKFEEVFSCKIKDYPIQYEIIFDTFNTFISFNNILFSTNYMKTSDRIDNSIHLLTSYLNKYKNKINKCYDSNCMDFYISLEECLCELTEMNKPNINVNLSNIKSNVEMVITALDKLRFDMIYDSKDLPFIKLPNDKLPKKISCKLVLDLENRKSLLFSYEKQKEENNNFIKDYYNKTGIDLNNDDKMKEIIFTIHITIANINNAIVDKMIFNDNGVFNLYMNELGMFFKTDIDYLEDIYYKNLFKKMKEIIKLLSKDNIKLAYKEISDIINKYSDLYQRIS